MNLKTKMLCNFVVFLFVGSLVMTGVNAYIQPNSTNADQTVIAETYGDDRRHEAVNILIYTEVADTIHVGEEFDNVLSSLKGSLEGKFTYDNLTDYTQLELMIDEFDVLLILESENGNFTFSGTVNAAWSGILPSFVNAGGIVICMSYAHGPGQYGASLGYINGTLLDITNPESAYSHQIDLYDTNDALARNMPASYTGASGSLSFDVSADQATKVMEDNTNAKPVVVHATQGKGHVVVLGFDMFTVDANQDTLLQNAVLLHRHVVFDNSHAQDYTINMGFTTLAEDLPFYGFSVSSMNFFDPAILDACDILVVTYCGTVYNSTEIAIIQNFVDTGGALLIVTERVSFGDATDPLMNSFGYARNGTFDLEDSDDSGTSPWFIHFMPENINMHSTKVGVDILEVYGSEGLIAMPEDAVPLVVTDSDGTATWDGLDAAIGVPVAAAQSVGEGRLIILCDNGFISDDDWDADATVNYMDADNEIFTRNVFRWLAGAGIPEQTVVFDQSHGPFSYVYSSYNPLANLLMFNGYNVEFMSSFNPTSFNDADILFIADGSIVYNATEITQIQTYVKNGGGLFLIGDHTTLSAEIDPIAQEFGLTYNSSGWLEDTDDFDTFDSYLVYEGNNIGSHPIMDGVDRLEVDRGTGFISIGSGTALVVTDGDDTANWSNGGLANNVPVYAATLHDMGRVVYVTDINLPGVGDADADGFGLLYDSDNSVFMGNVFKWLAENRAPTVEVITPNGGEVLNGTITIEWEGLDFDSDPLIYNVFYSDNNGSDWTLLESDLHVTEYEWNTTLHDDGTGYMIRVEVSDGMVSGADVSDDPFELDNFVGTGTGDGFDTTTLIIIIAAAGVVIIIIIIIMKKKK
ncbi:MAG: hypothetical protein ACTSSD_06215 [Candidatus Thorarchaeota archaeon]